MRASEKGPTPRGAVRWGSHARLMGEFEEPSPVFGSKDFFLDWRHSARGRVLATFEPDQSWPGTAYR
jgi:hypothetical protein